MTNLDKQITAYITYLEVDRGRTARTARNYDLYLRRFSAWLYENGLKTIEEVDQKTIDKFNLWLANFEDVIRKTKLKGKTKNYYLIALRGFLKFLTKKKIKCLDYRKIKLPNEETDEIKFLEKNEIESLLAAPLSTEKEKVIQLRDKALLELIFCTGLKVSIVSDLMIADLADNNSALNIANKSLKLDKIKLSNQARHWLMQYLKVRGAEKGFLFFRFDRAAKASNNDVGLSSRSIERIIAGYAAQAGIRKNVTPQMMRHSFVRINLLNGVDPEKVRQLIGNSSNTMMKKYLLNLK